MTTYQPQNAGQPYGPHRSSYSSGMPYPSSRQQPGAFSQGYPTDNPNYDPYMASQQAPRPEAAARRYSVPYSPAQPAVSPYMPPVQPNPQQQGYYPPAPQPIPAPYSQPQAYPPSSHPQVQPQPPQSYRPYPSPQQPMPPRHYPASSAIDDSITFDDPAYRPGTSGGGGAYAQRPRAYSASTAPYPRPPRDRRTSNTGSTMSAGRETQRGYRSHHSYEDEDGHKHYHKKDKRPTYGDSLLFAWDKARDFFSSRRE